MKAVTSLCDVVKVSLPVEEAPSPVNPDITYPQVVDAEPARIGPITTPFMLHVIPDNPDIMCPTLKIERVVACPRGCSFEEYKYAMPCMCGDHYLLPAGTYDITVCKQGVLPLQAGEELVVSFMVEPVDDTFVAAYRGNV